MDGRFLALGAWGGPTTWPVLVASVHPHRTETPGRSIPTAWRLPRQRSTTAAHKGPTIRQRIAWDGPGTSTPRSRVPKPSTHTETRSLHQRCDASATKKGTTMGALTTTHHARTGTGPPRRWARGPREPRSPLAPRKALLAVPLAAARALSYTRARGARIARGFRHVAWLAGIALALIFPAGAAASFVTEYEIPTANSGPSGIAQGPDDGLWFTENMANKIGSITVGGTVTEYRVPTDNSGPSAIAQGPDDALWFTENLAGKIGRITTDGRITEYVIPTVNSGPFGIAQGPRRCPVVHGNQRQQDRADHHRRDHHRVLNPDREQRPLGDHAGSGRGAVVHRKLLRKRRRRSQQDRADRHRRDDHRVRVLPGHLPSGDHCWSRRQALVHRLRRIRGRADHHQRVFLWRRFHQHN